MESWHGTKIRKYLALKTTIESNGLPVELFAVEVGAREYCSKFALRCLKKLGFNNTLIRKQHQKIQKVIHGILFLYLAGQK